MIHTWCQYLEYHLSEQGRRLFAWFPFGMACGISLYFSCWQEPSCYVIGGAIVLMLSGFSLLFSASRYPFYGLTLYLVGGALLSVALGFVLVSLESHRQPPFPELSWQGVWTEGWVRQVDHLPSRENQPERTRLTMEHVRFLSPWDEGSAPLKRYVRVTLKKGETHIPQTGDKIRVRAMLHTPSAPYWPSGRDVQREAWFSSLAGGGSALSSPYILVHSTHYALTRWRERIAVHISHVIPGQNGAIVAAVLSGETGTLTSLTRQEFAASGLAHLLAVAGLHLGLVIGGCFFVIRALLVRSEYMALRWPCRAIALWSALGIGCVYVLLTGMHIPGIRALGMAVYAAIAVHFGRRVLSLRALALVAILLECVHPAIIRDVSFQMSMAAVMALIAGYDEMRPILYKIQQKSWFGMRWGVPVVMGVLTSFFAGTATLPISMAYFGAFQPWFVVANIFAVPLMGVWIMPLGLIALALMPLGWDSPVLHMMGWGVGIVRLLAHCTAHLPGASIAVPSWPEWGVFLTFVGLMVGCLWRGKLRWVGVLFLVVGVASAWLIPRPVIILSPDGRAVAFRTAQGWMMDPAHGSMFLHHVWQREMGEEARPVPTECQKSICHVEIAGHRVVLDLRSLQDRRTNAFSSASIDLCDKSVLVVSYGYASMLCPGVPTIDKEAVDRDGAWAVYAQVRGELKRVSDREVRGERLWVLPVGSHGVPNLPLAKEE